MITITPYTATLFAAVARGLRALDETEPTCFLRVDTEILDLSSTTYCVLGQAFDGYSDGTDELGIRDGHDYGFDRPAYGYESLVPGADLGSVNSVAVDGAFQFRQLDVLWITLIKGRQERLAEQALVEHLQANPSPLEPTQEHVILVALQVAAPDREQAHANAERFLGPVMGGGPIVAWWVAEDDRTDGSDCSSAVFLPVPPCDQYGDDSGYLTQEQATVILQHAARVSAPSALDALRCTVA